MKSDVVFYLPLKLLPVFALATAASGQSNVQVVADPSFVWAGHTDHLVVNCTFARTSHDLSALSFLVLSKTDTEVSNTYRELAIVPGTGAAHYVDVKNALGATVTGKLEAQGSSFIAFQWSPPGESAKGRYRCEAHGVDSTGHPVSSTAITVVDGKVKDFDLLVDMIQHVNNSIHADTSHTKIELQQCLQNHSSILANQSQQMANHSAEILSLEKMINNLTKDTSNYASAQLNDIKTQFADLQNNLLNRTYLQTIRVNDLQNDLNTYKAGLDRQSMNISNHDSQINNLETLFKHTDTQLTNQTSQINDIKSQISNLQAQSSNQTLGQSLADLQREMNSTKEDLSKERQRVDRHNQTLELYQQEIDTQNLQINTLARQLNNLTALLLDQTASLSRISSRLQDIDVRLNSSRSALFQSSYTLGGRQYLVSWPHWRDMPLAESLCLLHGGYLAEIDDQAEMTALVQHLTAHQMSGSVFVSGSDAASEGRWTYARTGSSMTFTSWAPGFPSSSVFENCVMLAASQGWKMENTRCVMEEWDRFVCEL